MDKSKVPRFYWSNLDNNVCAITDIELLHIALHLYSFRLMSARKELPLIASLLSFITMSISPFS